MPRRQNSLSPPGRGQGEGPADRKSRERSTLAPTLSLSRERGKVFGWVVVAAVAISAPPLVAVVAPGQQRYIVHVLIFTALFAALALSYDLVVGHVCSLSLAHPAFFGVGAYTAAILATGARWPFVADVLAAALGAALAAALVGVPLFRLA